MDTTRADHLSAYGYERDTSPRLRALAAEGVLFRTFYAPSATTGPSHASLFTSLYPMDHGVIKNGRILGDPHETLAEALARAGFATASIVSSYVLHEKFGYAQGFDTFDSDFSRSATPSGVRSWEGHRVEGKFNGSAEDTTGRAVEWLEGERPAERPFFLFVHYFDPHDPYVPPKGYRPPFPPDSRTALKTERAIYLYDVLLAYTDQEIGRLLDDLERLGLADDTLVIVTGDHGEGLMQHGHMFHGAHIYEEGVRIPLIARWPGRIEPGRVVEGAFTLLDLAPTLLELTGATGGEEHRGRSLVPVLLEGESGEADRPIFLYRRYYEGEQVAPGLYVKGDKFGVREGRWKYIEGPEEGTRELFDLANDPEERENLAERHPERVAAMAERIREWRSANSRAHGDDRAPSIEDRMRLEALGYVE